MSPLRFFNDAEAAVVRAIAERIFPATADSPGATDAHVVDYIDGQLASAWGRGDRTYRHAPYERPAHSGHGWQSALTPADAYRHGLAALAGHVGMRHEGRTFDRIGPHEQDAVLEAMSRGETGDLGGIPPAELFAMIRQNVVEGLFADPAYEGNHELIGWRWIGFPGDPDAYGDPYSDRIDRFDQAYHVEPRGLPKPSG